MFSRSFRVLLSIWLLAGLGSAQDHWHEHQHDNDAAPAHVHVVNAYDADHADAHASGAVDVDCNDDGLISRSQLKADQSPALAQCVPVVETLTPTLAIGYLREMPGHGPPAHLRPPSQAPPAPFAFA